MKRLLLLSAGTLALLIVAGLVLRQQLTLFVMGFAMAPRHDFADQAPPAAADYSDDAAWGALPALEDPADGAPDGLADAQESARADVFFVHPTTYLARASWNQPLDDSETNEITDGVVFQGQASAFNGCCGVFAPRYRQATLYSFLDDKGNGVKALDLAYDDVERAFDSFLGRIGEDRPFIVAGHSQGAKHAERLLRERITGTPLRERLVAAYPIGFSFQTSDLEAQLPDIPVCASAEQNHCLVTWNTVGPAVTHFEDPAGQACVNPLTWTSDSQQASHADNPGSLSFVEDKRLLAGVADARCDGGVLMVSEVRDEGLYDEVPGFFGPDNHHIIDVHLFYAALHRNAIERVDAWWAARPPVEADGASPAGADTMATL